MLGMWVELCDVHSLSHRNAHVVIFVTIIDHSSPPTPFYSMDPSYIFLAHHHVRPTFSSPPASHAPHLQMPPSIKCPQSSNAPNHQMPPNLKPPQSSYYPTPPNSQLLALIHKHKTHTKIFFLSNLIVHKKNKRTHSSANKTQTHIDANTHQTYIT